VNALWSTIAAEVPALATMSYKSIPSTGLLLDGTPFASLPFVEGQSLHFEPAAAAVTTA
jgi:NADH-quinone oxidoreductase subunit G